MPYSLGPSPRFVLARLPGGRRAAVTYSLRSDVRGRYPVGPLRLRLTDPFGMCELTRSFTATDPLVVVPRTVPADRRPRRVASGPAPVSRWRAARPPAARTTSPPGSTATATTCAGCTGGSTARRGELMVRRDEQPRQMRATVLLDTRRDGHRGEGPASSFEWAVGAAASVAVALAGQRYGVRLLHRRAPRRPGPARTPATAPGSCSTSWPWPPGTARSRWPARCPTLARGGGDGLVVAVLGEVGPRTRPRRWPGWAGRAPGASPSCCAPRPGRRCRPGAAPNWTPSASTPRPCCGPAAGWSHRRARRRTSARSGSGPPDSGRSPSGRSRTSPSRRDLPRRWPPDPRRHRRQYRDRRRGRHRAMASRRLFGGPLYPGPSTAGLSVTAMDPDSGGAGRHRGHDAGGAAAGPLVRAAGWFVADLRGGGADHRSGRERAPGHPALADRGDRAEVTMLVIGLTALFARDDALWGVLPGPAAWATLGDLLAEGLEVTRRDYTAGRRHPGALAAGHRRDRRRRTGWST